ncbi:MAG: CusA/CzcA family heavy metal efflux RND transporter [Deltaproteobacteria bacterium]|nr:CusA/CzcA family heavy metal efflux RND transporter [Deltaproteobacteria bacterium]
MFLLSKMVSWSLHNRVVVLMATILFVIAGLASAVGLPIDAVPDITNVQVQVITSAPALSPVEMEQYVTVPVERAMAGIPKVTEVRSLTKYGLSVVTIVFDEGTDIYFARQMVSERVREAEADIPEAYGRPQIGPIASGLGEIYQFVVRGKGHSLMELEETLDWYIGPQLRTVPGIVEVNSFGGEERQYQVVVDPKRLQAAGLSLQEVVSALERTNANAGGGYIEHNREQLVIGTLGLVKSLEDLKSVVVGATPQGVPITIANVGDVRFGARLRRGAASMDGQGEVVVGVALMLIGENSRVVTDLVKARLDELRPTLPKGITVEPFYDRAALVDRTIRTVARNLAEGAALVVVVLLVLLGNLRAGLIVAVTIPLSMLFAVMIMRMTGASGNLMSLGAVDFGLIVDAAVIIVENAVRRLTEVGAARGQAPTADERLVIVQDAAIEVRSASVFGEAIIGIVYLPILALRGVEGKLFHPMAQTVLFALLGAFILSLTVVPVLCSYFLRPERNEHETWVMRQLRRGYLPLLKTALARPSRTLGVGLALLALGAGLSTRLGAEFVPQLDEGDLLLEVRRLPGVALTESVAMDVRIERSLAHIPEIEHVVARNGAPEVATDPMGIEQSDVYITLKPTSKWRDGLTKLALGEEISAAVEKDVPEVSFAVSQPIQMRTNELVAGVRSDAAALIYGPDLATLQELGTQVQTAFQGIDGVVDVRAEQTAGLAYLRVRPDRARLARYGLTVQDVNMVTETIAVGRNVGTVFEGDRRFGMVVRSNAEFKGNLDVFRSLPLKSSSGQMVPLGDVAEVAIESGPVLVNRDKQSRRTIVEFNVRGRDVVSAVEDARMALNAKVHLPTGYRIEWGGQFQNYASARARLMIVVPLALALILFLLWLAFDRVKPSLLVFINIPFAAIGGVLFLWLRDMPFSISAGVGFIALFGVAVLNGLVLVSFCLQLEAKGTPPAEAIASAARMRLRPVLMTAFVAALGFVPMALSHSAGSEVQRPLATVVIGGLITATALTLLFFPTAYEVAHNFQRGSKRKPT